MTDEIADLPNGWKSTNLGSLGQYLNGRAFKSSEWKRSGRPIIRIQDLTGTNRNPNYFDGEVDDRYVVRSGDLLVSWSATLGAYIWDGPEAVLNQHIFKVQSTVDKRLHYHLLRNSLAELQRNAHGSGMVHVTKGIFDATPVALPENPVDQAQLASLIDSSELSRESAIGHIEAALRDVVRFRQAVMDSACSGRLTSDGDGGGQDGAVPAMLARIRTARASNRKDHPLRGIDPSLSLPEIPAHWRWVSLDQLIEQGPQNGLYLPASRYGRGHPILRIEDFQVESSRSSNDLKRVEATESEVETYSLSVGDLVINRVNSPSHLGKSMAVATRHLPALFESNMMRIRLSPEVEPEYVALFLRSWRGRAFLIRNAKWAVNQASINQKDVRGAVVPLPPASVQRRIVAVVNAMMTVADRVNVRILQAQRSVRRSPQAVLFKGFRGGLSNVERAI